MQQLQQAKMLPGNVVSQAQLLPSQFDLGVVAGGELVDGIDVAQAFVREGALLSVLGRLTVSQQLIQQDRFLT